MRVLFIHRTWPAQFGHVGLWLARSGEFEVTFLSRRPPDIQGGIERLQYSVPKGVKSSGHSCLRNVESSVYESLAVFDALRGRPDVQPDLIVAHSGFFHSVYLRELYDCPIVNYFEYFYRPGADSGYREDLPGVLDHRTSKNLRLRTRNATLLLDLDNCDAGYSPIRWQRDCLPREYHPKVSVLFDGVDTTFWKHVEAPSRKIGDREIPEDKLVVTYVARGLEPIRGFDIFMDFAQRLMERRDDTVFVVVGHDKIV